MSIVTFFVSIRFVLGSLFLYAGINKLRTYAHFYTSILTFKIVSPSQARILAYILPLGECISGFLLFIGVKARIMAIIIAFLLVLFIILFVISWVRKLDVSCNCFGKQQNHAGTSIPYAILRNIVLASITITLIFAPDNALQTILSGLQIQTYLIAFIIATGVIVLVLLCNLIINMLLSIRNFHTS